MSKTANTQPRFDPIHQEWSVRIGPDTWLGWKHGDRPEDEGRLQEALAAELDCEEVEDR